MANILLSKQGKIVLKFKKLTEHAIKPMKASELSAGYDLFSAYENNVTSKGSALIKTDLQIQVPDGCYGRIAPRSGLALKHSIDVGAGVIDADYRGNVGVILFNFGDSDFQVKKGDRIAQLICEKIEYPELEEVDEGEIMEVTSRGVNGFGSS
ncbi:deoxyuridine 5'-triphosphate nucleotidohydrolase-like [Tetranychus urticae]|uniref:Deoxyuridine 5'-triphosphate nucleotidohydrolase n=1 Tax=Tetranychus urticae TaxID=32264 RepID=T1K113_TETUR|nr:deoxyuridine 5'-triphosphate nucleotidohydrolase-like [Tetranychus urticae]